MKPAELVSLQTLVQDFFEKHLGAERNASRNTVLAYRDGLRLYLGHAAERAGCRPEALGHAALDADAVREFLRWLESHRRCGARTRNLRLAAIKAFSRYVGYVAPEHLERARRICEIPSARFEHPKVNYLEDGEMVKLVQAVDPAGGIRDRALVLLLYNTGARVQELVDLDIGDLRLDPAPIVTLHGKGRKQRTCPLWARTVEALQTWLAERGRGDQALFLNRHGRRLTRSGVAHILATLAARAELSPRNADRVSPHVIRHTTAMHLLQAGVDITTIAAWLGHAQLSTTHGYIEIDLRMKQAAVAETTVPFPELAQGSYPNGPLLDWLAALGRAPRYAQSWQPTAARTGGTRHQLSITARSP